MSKKLWVVGKYRGGKAKNVLWDFNGVFDSKLKAEEACIDSTYFIGPVVLNQSLPHETIEWPNCSYPRR